jgi:hypothetical protein
MPEARPGVEGEFGEGVDGVGQPLRREAGEACGGLSAVVGHGWRSDRIVSYRTEGEARGRWCQPTLTSNEIHRHRHHRHTPTHPAAQLPTYLCGQGLEERHTRVVGQPREG